MPNPSCLWCWTEKCALLSLAWLVLPAPVSLDNPAPFLISLLIRAPPAAQPQRKGLFSILQLSWEWENPWVEGKGACQAWKDAW